MPCRYARSHVAAIRAGTRTDAGPVGGEGAPLNAGLPPAAAALAGLDGVLQAADAPQAAAVRVDRAGTELRRGRLLALRVDAAAAEPAAEAATAGWLLVAAVETLTEEAWRALAASGVEAALWLSAERLLALGRPAVGPQALRLGEGVRLAELQRLAALAPDETTTGLPGDVLVADPAMQQAMRAGLALCKRARLVPALVALAWPAAAEAALMAAQVPSLDPGDVLQATAPRPGDLRRVSDARVPLASHEDCRLVLFREVDGDAEHVAIVVGDPVPGAAPVPVRLHSACLTGDLLGSLRCDCGPQLQRALARLAETGGVLLYLAQEGRGTGLANKLRAYRLQDAGLDTLQADRHLGFRADERDFGAAAAMLRELGFTRIRLLTNNPHKIDALRAAGIEVVDREPLLAPVNRHNARYVRTKRQRAGHLGADG